MKRRKLPKSKPKQPPPKHGIKVRRFGVTWWGQRWIEALEHLSREYLTRLGRGRLYAREGRVHDLSIAPGLVNALVTGSEIEPYVVRLRIAVLPPASWQKAIEAMSKQAVFAAELLSGRMPKTIDEAFRSAGHSLFLVKQREIEADCTCDDWVNPCKHVAALHYVLGEAFDKDPFLLFELRGRTRAQVLGALRAMRSGDAALLDPLEAKLAKAAKEKMAQAELAARTVSGVALTECRAEDFEHHPAPLPRMAFHIETPKSSGALLQQLGAPPSWLEEDAPFATLAELYRAASLAACELALPEERPTKRRST